MLLLNLPGSSLINSHRLTSELQLQLPGSSKSTARGSLQCCCCNCLGIVDKQQEDPSHAAVATVWEYWLNSQRFSPMLLLQLPGSS